MVFNIGIFIYELWNIELILMEWLWFDYVNSAVYVWKIKGKKIISNLNGIDINGLMSRVKIHSHMVWVWGVTSS